MESQWILALVAVICLTQSARGDERSFVSRLLEDYQFGGNRGRPVLNHTDIVQVDVAVSLNQILAFDQYNQYITLSGRVTLQWKDHFLAWGDEGPSEISLPPENIWTPDIVIINVVDKPRYLYDTRVQVHRDGHMIWVLPQRLTVSCATTPEENEPSCDLEFSSWSLGQQQLQLTADRDRIDAGFYVPSHEWELSKTKAVANERKYLCCPDKTFGDLTFTFALKKRPQEEDDEDKNKEAGASALRGSQAAVMILLALVGTKLVGDL